MQMPPAPPNPDISSHSRDQETTNHNLQNDLPATLTDDEFLGGQLKIFQPEKGFRAGIDSVLLAASIPAQAGDRVFEAGIGTGVAALCLARRVDEISITGIELSGRYSMLAAKNIERNDLEQSISVINGDIKDAMRRDLSQWPAHGSFMHAYANPPFYDRSKVQASPDLLKANANAFDASDLELWIKVMTTMVKPRGTVTLINRPENLGQILAAMEGKLGDIRIAPLFPRVDSPANRIIVRGIKASKGPITLQPGMVIHKSDNQYNDLAEGILRRGEGWTP